MSKPEAETRVLLLPPSSKDAVAAQRVFSSVGIDCVLCSSIEVLCAEIELGAGAAVVPEEAIMNDYSHCLARTLSRQPHWSDLPLIVLSAANSQEADSPAYFGPFGHMTLVRRPIELRTFVTTIRAALRDRTRQYQRREYLIERERHAEAILESEARLRFALDSGQLGDWDLDLLTKQMNCSPICKAHFGIAAAAEISYDAFLSAIHPDDRHKVVTAMTRALAERSIYDVECRNLRPDGSVRWVMVRGRGLYAPDGIPVQMTGVTLDTTLSNQSREALRESYNQLRQNDRRKDEFLAMLAHELRNPLAAVGNAVTVLKISNDPKNIDFAKEVVERQVKQLVRLIDDLLDVSRITSGKIRLRREYLDCRTVLTQAVESVRPLITERAHELRCTFEDAELRAYVDPTRLEQIVVNLLTNAAKYTERGGQIWLTARRENESLLIEVRDTGMGISPERLPEMFQLFAQGERSIARSEGGLGIGLTIVLKLTEMHGGTVSAASEGPGKGSQFVVHLPAANAQSPRAPEAVPEEATALDGSKILVVDDNIDTAVSMCRFLQLLGNEVLIAHDGPTAIDTARSFMPEFILLDIGLPGMDGYQVAATLKADLSCKNTIIVAVSGYGQQEDRRRSRASGFDYHLVKPVELEVLVRLLIGAKRSTVTALDRMPHKVA